jgi:hypothetical protein
MEHLRSLTRNLEGSEEHVKAILAFYGQQNLDQVLYLLPSVDDVLRFDLTVSDRKQFVRAVDDIYPNHELDFRVAGINRNISASTNSEAVYTRPCYLLSEMRVSHIGLGNLQPGFEFDYQNFTRCVAAEFRFVAFDVLLRVAVHPGTRLLHTSFPREQPPEDWFYLFPGKYRVIKQEAVQLPFKSLTGEEHLTWITLVDVQYLGSILDEDLIRRSDRMKFA